MTVTIRNPFVGHGSGPDPRQRAQRPQQYRYTLTPIDDMFTSPTERDRRLDRAERRTGLLAITFALCVVLAAVIASALLVVDLVHSIFTYFA
jgi:hypothetical protein